MTKIDESKLREQIRKENRKHLKQVLSHLPQAYQKKASMNADNFRIMGAEVKLRNSNGGWFRSRPQRPDRLVIELDYTIRDALGDKYRRTRTYKRLNRDGGVYSYEKAAAYLQRVLDAYSTKMQRRASGEKQASVVGERMKALFKADPILAGLNLDVRSKPVTNTECGETEVIFAERSESDYSAISFLTTGNGEGFRGTIEVHSLTPEQVVALVIVLKVDRLQLLDMLTLADDSILGPIIKRMTEEKEDIDAA